jgi:hypothetical protein
MTAAATPEPPRSRAQRKSDTLEKLGAQVDLWVASADEAGNAHLIPMSHHWDGLTLMVSTPRDSRTGRNLLRAGWARVALGPTRDVVVIEGPVELIEIGADPARENAHAGATGFDPRTLAEDWIYLRIVPDSIRAWREANEIPGRLLMKGGEWLA